MSAPGRTLIDGQHADVSLLHDRGLHYGDGVFETMVLRDGRVRFFERHLERLRRGCAALGIEPPARDELTDDLTHLDTPDSGVLKLIVTRGDGRRGYAPAPGARARRIWLAHDWPDPDPAQALAARGADVVWLDTVLATQPALAGIKHLNRLEQVLAARELAATDADEGLLRDAHGHVIEAVSANVFLVRDGQLTTPALTGSGVAGILREVVLECAAGAGIAARIEPLRRADFALADEVFLTSSVRGLLPVRRLGVVPYTQRAVTDVIRRALAERDDS